MYQCPNTSCAIHIKGKDFEKNGECPLCDTPLVLQLTLSDFQKEVLNKYPYVIAYPYKRMLEETDGRNRLELLNFTFHNILKYLGLISASEYFQSIIKSPNLNTLFRNTLYQPTIGHWNKFVRESIKELKAQNHSWVFPELTDVYEQMETGKKVKRYLTQSEYTNDEGLIDYKKIKETAIGTLIVFRNLNLGHGVPLQTEAYKDFYNSYSPILEDLLLGIKPLAEIPMLKSERFDVYSLMGTTVAQLQGIQMPKGLTTGQIWLQEGARVLGLLPFYVLPGTFAQKTGKSEVFVYEQNTSKRIVFFSPESEKAESEGEVLERLNLLLSIKEKESPLEKEGLSLDAIRERAQQYNKKTREGLIKEKKTIEGIYQNRQNAEAELRGWVGARAGLFFISATAGAGKTNLLNYIEGEYPRLDACPILLRASRIGTPYLLEAIREALNVGATVTMEDILQFFTQESPLMVLVDGGNEHPKNKDFLQSVVAAIQTHNGGSLKVVLTWRANTLSELPVLNNLGDELYASITNKGQEQLPAKHALLLNPMDRMEVESAWETYINHPSKKYSPKFTLADLDIADRPLSDQLSNPLLLKMFLELFNGKTLKQKGEGFADIWALWWGRLTEKEAQLLKQFALLLIEKDSQQVLLDDLYTHPELKKDVAYIQVDSPFQQLTNKGILSLYFKDNLLIVSFTMEAMMHQALAQVLWERVAGKEDILGLLNVNKGWVEPVKCYLKNLVKKDELDLLNELIREDGLDVEMLAEPLALALIIKEIDVVLNKLLETDSVDVWYILCKSIEFLIDTNEIRTLYKISTRIFEHSLNAGPESLPIILQIFEYLLKEDKEKCLININNYMDYIETLDDKYFYYFKIGHIEHINGNYEKAIEYYQKAYQFTIIKKIINKNDLSVILQQIGILYGEIGNYNKALRYLEESLDVIVQSLGSECEMFSDCLRSISIIYDYMGQYEKSIYYLDKSLNISLKLLGENHIKIADLLSSKGKVFTEMGDFDNALENLLKGHIIDLKLFQKEIPLFSTSYLNIGRIYNTKGQYEKAIEYYLKSQKILKEYFNESHPDLADIYNNLGNVYDNKGNYDIALKYFFKSLNINKQVLEKKHSRIATDYHNIGNTYRNKGKYQKALKYSNKSLCIRLKVLGSDYPDLAYNYNNLALLHSIEGNHLTAIKLYKKGLHLVLNRIGKEHELVSIFLNNIGFVYDDLKQFSKAKKYYFKALKVTLNTFGSKHVQIGISYNNIGTTLDNLEEFDKALKYHTKSLRIFLKSVGPQHSYTAQVYSDIGSVYFNKEEYVVSLEYYIKSFEIKKVVLEQGNNELIDIMFKIGIIYKKINDFKASISIISDAFNITQNATYGFEIADSYEKLNDLENALKYYILSSQINYDEFGLDCVDNIVNINHTKRVALQINKTGELPDWMK